MKIKRENLLIEKKSGSYGCPNYIDPKFGKAILDAHNIKSTKEGVLLFTEVIENFGIEIIKHFKNELTRDKVIKLANKIEIG